MLIRDLWPAADSAGVPGLSRVNLLPDAGSVEIATPGDVGMFGPAPLVGVTFFALWVTAGLVTAVIMSRHGHDLRSNGAVGLVFGPLYIPFAMRLRMDERAVKPVLVAEGRSGPGPVDVLIGLQGSPAGAASALSVLHLLGNRVGRVTLARVLDFESIQDDADRAAAEAELSCASLFLGEYEPSLLLLPGHPLHAPREHAAAAGFDAVIVVGDRGGAALPKRRRASSPGDREPLVLVVADAPQCERRA
jgi:hypothetical protein